MGRQRSLRSKAVHLVSDLTTVLLNPISDKPSNKPSSLSGHEAEPEKSQHESISEEGDVEGEGSVTSVDEPDTSSFTAFLYSLLKDDYFAAETEDGKQHDNNNNITDPVVEPLAEPGTVNVVVKGSGGKRGLLSRGKQSLGKAMSIAATLAGFRNQASDKRSGSVASNDNENGCQEDGRDSRMIQSDDDDKGLSLADLPDMSEPSELLSQKTRLKLYASLPSLAKGRKWVLLYSTWRHGISLSTLYRKSMLCPGLSLLVVGDRGGAVFGGLVEAPLKPSRSRRYQGTNTTFLFSDAPGQAVIYRPTGANRYYTLCSPDFLALGGGRHFALYLDSDLLSGSSAVSDTYGNSCLALSENFDVKEIELWGFVYASKYEEILAKSQNEPPGICRW